MFFFIFNLRPILVFDNSSEFWREFPACPRPLDHCVAQGSRVGLVLHSFLPSVYFVMIKKQHKIGKKLSLEINLLLVWGSFFSEASLSC